MTVKSESESKKETLLIDSIIWDKTGGIYTRTLEVKLKHNTEIVWFSTAPHQFTVKIYDCEDDMETPTKWIV
jgi:hypothetical protein